MNTLTRFKEIDEYYNNSMVKFEIIKSLHGKWPTEWGSEMAFLIPSWIVNKDLLKTSTRMLKCHSVQHFDYWRKERIRMIERGLPYNMFYSLSKYFNGIPQQTANFSLRDNSEWETHHYDFMRAYDFLIDIDAGSHEDITYAYESAKIITDYFYLKNIPYILIFSGKGFHIIIPYAYFSKEKIDKECFVTPSFNPHVEMNIYSIFYKIAKALHSKFSEMIDINIYDSRRLCKIPFSLALYEEAIYVCYPFNSMEEFDNFNIQDYELKNFNMQKIAEAQANKKRKIFNPEGNITNLISLI